MNIDYLIAIASLITSSIAAFAGWRFYARFGRGSRQWGWLLVMTSSISLAASELLDAYATFQGGGFAELSDFFAILTEILLTVGFVRMFNRELVEEKLHHQKLESDLVNSEGLLSASMQMTSSLNLQEILLTLLQRTIALIGADLAAIYLDERSGKLAGKYFGVRRNSDRISERKQELGGITQQVLTTGKPVLIENLREHTKNISTGMPEKLTALGGFPLRENGEILGALFVGFDQIHSFGEDQQLLLMGIADHGALALRNATLYERVENLSLSDSLTGLGNRRQFDHTLAVELARARRYGDSLSLIILDVDHFKQINDTQGHPAGDAALKHIAEILKTNLRLTDLAARVGGEEMALILQRSEPDEAAQLAKRLRESIQQMPFIWEGKVVELTCSFGVSGGRGEMLPKEPLEIYKWADAALYRAKEEGRDRVVAVIQ